MKRKDPSEWLRRENWHFNFKDFHKTLEKSVKECTELPKINELLFIVGWIFATFLKIPKFFVEGKVSEKYRQSLTFTCFIEFMHNSNCTTFLTASGLYKNAYHNLRYALESIVHSTYIDLRHPDSDFKTKIEILDEVENLPAYHGVKLVKDLEISNKDDIMREYDKINKEYKKLSRNVHFTYRHLLVTEKNIIESSVHSTEMDCSEVSRIYDSMKTVYDFFIFLFLSYFPELKEPLTKNEEFTKAVKDHNLNLVCKILNSE